MSVPAQAESTTPAGSPSDQGSTGLLRATQAQETPAANTQTPGAETQEQGTRGPDHFRNAFAAMRGYTQSVVVPAPTAPPVSPSSTPVSGDAAVRVAPNGSTSASPAPPGAGGAGGTVPGSPVVETLAGAAPAPGGPGTTLPPRSAVPASAAQPQTISLTPEELDRQTQSRADKLIAKREKDAQAAADKAEEVRLRREQPFEYARLMEDRERELEDVKAEAARLNSVAAQQIHEFDRAVLDPLVSAVPAAVFAKIQATVKPEGLKGRTELVKHTLGALRQQWISEGRKTTRDELLKDPLFQKEMRARFGGSVEPEPTTPGRGAASAAQPADENAAMNSFMRFGAQAARQTSGRG